VNTIRPKVSLYAGIGAGIITLLAVVPALFAGAWNHLPGLICTIAAIDLGVWVFFINPRISYDTERVIVVNPLRIFKADWAAVTGFETKFGLAIVTASKKFVAWSAPAPSRREVRRISKHDLKGTSLENQPFIEPGLVHGFESGTAFWQLEEVRASNTAKTETVNVSTNWLSVIALLVIAGLAYIDLHI
jgi:hypothetical protein